MPMWFLLLRVRNNLYLFSDVFLANNFIPVRGLGIIESVASVYEAEKRRAVKLKVSRKKETIKKKVKINKIENRKIMKNQKKSQLVL